MKKRLSDARYLIGDVLFAIGKATRGARQTLAAWAATAGRSLRRLGGSIAGVWQGLSLVARRRIAAALGAVAVIVLFLVLAVPNLPCSFPGGDSCPPADDAAELVPASAIAYVHVNADPGTEQYEKAAAIAERAPLLARQIISRALVLTPGALGGAPDFRRRVEPWFGGEAAIALVRGPGESAERVTLLENDDPDRARKYADGLAAGDVQRQRYRDAEIAVDQRGVASALIQGFLVVGTPTGVRAIADVAADTKGSASLADAEAAEDLRDRLPEHRFFEAWMSPAGARALAGSSFSFLAPFVSPGQTRGAALSLSAGDDSLELAVRSELDSGEEKAPAGFFAAFPSFDPSLPERLPADAFAYLGLGEPGRTVKALLGQAAEQAPGIAGSFDDLVDSLRKQDEVNINKDLLRPLGDEGALAIGAEGGEDPGALGAPPFLEFVGEGVDEERVRRALADLQKPLADAFNPGSGLQAPVFGEQEVDGVAVHSVGVSPTVELAYAVFDGLAAVATSPAGIEQLIKGDGGLDSTDTFERATEDFPDEVKLLAYLDLEQLLAAGFQAGLAEVPAFATFSADLRRLDALGLEVDADGDVLSTDARLLLSD